MYFIEGTQEICMSMVDCWRQSNGGQRNIEKKDIFFVFSARDRQYHGRDTGSGLYSRKWMYSASWGLCQD